MRYVTRIWPFGVRKEKVDEENGGKKKKKGRYFGWIIKIAAVLCTCAILIYYSSNPHSKPSLPLNPSKFPEKHEKIPEKHEKIPENLEEFPEKHEKFPEKHEKIPENLEEFPEKHEKFPEKQHDKIPEKQHEKIPENLEEFPELSEGLHEVSEARVVSETRVDMQLGSESIMWFDGAGVKQTVDVNHIFQKGWGQWSIGIGLKTTQGGPLWAMKGPDGDVLSLLYIFNSTIRFRTSDNADIIEYKHKEILDSNWHFVSVRHDSVKRKLTLILDGKVATEVRISPLNLQKCTTITLGYSTDAFPPFEDSVRMMTRQTVISRTYYYGALANGYLTMEKHSMRDIDNQCKEDMAKLEHLKYAKGKPPRHQVVRLDKCQEKRRVSKERNQTLVLYSVIFGPLGRTHLTLLDDFLARSRKELQYMDKRENSGAVPMSVDILERIRDRDGDKICFPYSIAVMTPKELTKGIPKDLTQPLDTDAQKGRYFSKITFIRQLYMRRAIEEAEKVHLEAYKRPLADTDVVYISRPDMMAFNDPKNLEYIMEAIRLNPLRIFVYWHPVWGNADMMFIISGLMARRMIRLDLKCASNKQILDLERNTTNNKGYLDGFEPELQLYYMFRILCGAVYVDVGDNLNLDKLNHERGMILRGLRNSGKCTEESSRHPNRPAGHEYGGLTWLEKVHTSLGREFCDFKIGMNGIVSKHPECLPKDVP
ncbi:hypothetical protein AAMO2058_000554900 [Amorphochlora amoebiformis]